MWRSHAELALGTQSRIGSPMNDPAASSGVSSIELPTSLTPQAAGNSTLVGLKLRWQEMTFRQGDNRIKRLAIPPQYYLPLAFAE